MDIKAKILHNKCNNQLMIALNRKKFDELKKDKKLNPKFLSIKVYEFLEE